MTRYQRDERRAWPWVTLGVLAAAAALAGLFAWDAVRLRGAADDLTVHASAARQALEDSDAEALATEVSEVEAAAQTFVDATHGPHWQLATLLPWVEDQAEPLMAAGASVGRVAEGALAPLAELGDLEALEVPGFEDGRVDPYALEPYREALGQASAVLAQEGAYLGEVDLTGTLPQVRDPFRDLEEQLASLSGMIDGAHLAAELLPTMLGGEGERRYLVVVQNNAEPRATGGLLGAFLEVAVDDGRMSLGGYSSAWSLIDLDGATELTEDEERIFTWRMAAYPHDANFTPEFPRTARIVADFWEGEHGGTVDGVVSVDPVALGWMLAAMDPTEVAGLTLTGDTLADVMLNRAYAEFDDPEEQDAFFALTSRELFGALVSGQGTSLAGVERAIDAGRLLVWSADDDEQALLASAPIAGGFLERDDALGVFLNDGSGSKIGYYIDREVTVTPQRCAVGGDPAALTALTVEVAFTHTYDGDVADLPDYVSGGGEFVPEGEFRGNLLVYPPVGFAVTRLVKDGEDAETLPSFHDARRLSQARVTLAPGESRTFVYTLTPSEPLAEWVAEDVEVVQTPGAKEQQLSWAAAAQGC